MSTPTPVPPATAPNPTPVLRSPLPAPKVLLEGPTGTGKTFSLGTLADAGIDVCLLALEQGYETLFGYWTDRGLPVPPNVYVHEVAATKANFSTLAAAAKMVNQLSFESLIKYTDPDRSKHDQLVTVLEGLHNFTDTRSGKKLGAVDTWGTGRCIAIDSLSPLSAIAMNLFVGGRIAVDQKDWGLGQRNLENLIRQLCQACRCWFVLTSHVERETDQVLGGSKITVSTLGRALAPKIPPMFSDVILTTREMAGTSPAWYWDTLNVQADLKTRNLPWAQKIKPDFGQIVAKWKSRGGIVEVNA